MHSPLEIYFCKLVHQLPEFILHLILCSEKTVALSCHLFKWISMVLGDPREHQVKPWAKKQQLDYGFLTSMERILFREVQFHFLKIHPNNEVDFMCELSWQTLLWILFLTYLLAYTELVSPAQCLCTPESDKEAICWMPYQPREKNRCQVKAGQPMHPSSLKTHDSLNLNHSYNL